MLGRKKKSKYSDFAREDIPPSPPGPGDMDFDDADEIREIKRIRPREQINTKMRPMPDDESDATPPLFVKIDKYDDIVNHISKLKSLSLGLRDALDALAEIEKEIATGVAIANKSLDSLNVIANELELRFAKVSGARGKVPEHVEEYIKNSYDKIEKMKERFDDIEE
ncbi:MAG: hypothetical protein KKB03_02815 [Nanoarchaeota archaeon]|nr:hypothetical protein [Nanoarchaeota archaeon]MBU1135499.1 hypothetical protein [Nanoarchaeota archaeon]MBU2520148.1 hypothetical protein [Nanoarchaeota archaeon]